MVIVGVLCVLALLLTFGVIRRLREHEELISRSPHQAMPPAIGLSAAEHVADFSAVTVAGELLSDAPGLPMAAFFSTTCSVCPERVGPFLNYLAEHRIKPDTARRRLAD